MKKIILLGILSTIAAFTTTAQNVYIPDPVFKAFLVNHSYPSNPTGPNGTTIYLDANHDGEIQVSEAANYTSDVFSHGFSLNGSVNPIYDLTGIEAFKKIEYLNITNCPLTTPLTINGCTSLKTLKCTNISFTSFSMNNSAVKELELVNCSSLTSVTLAGFGLETLRINSNANLTAVNLGIHTALTLFQCGNNPLLTSLDVSSCAALQHFYAQGNQLSSLNLANGHPQSFIGINVTGYPNLTCIKVDNVMVSDYLWGNGYPYEFDAWASFDTDCTPPGPCVIAIPDANFKAALLANSAINTNGNNEIECTEATAYTGAVNVNNIAISNLKGIEAFVNITSFSGNNIQVGYGSPTLVDTLDLSNFTSLTSVSCTGNVGLKYLKLSGCTALTNVDVSTGLVAGVGVNLNGCTALTSLNLSNKKLNALNVNGCTALTSLNCSNNLLTTLDVSSNTALTALDCSRNQLTTLNTFNQANLSTLNCSYNQLPYLIVSLNTGLTTLDCSHNNITYLDVNNNTLLTSLNCSYNQLPNLGTNNTGLLTNLDCSHNQLTNLNITSSTSLTTLNCSFNLLPALNVSNNTAIVNLYCSDNLLPTIDVSNNNPALVKLDCSNNLLTTIDISSNTALRDLNCSGNQLPYVDFSNNTSLLVLYCSNNQLTSLNLNAPNLVLLDCSKNPFTSLDFSSQHIRLLYCSDMPLLSSLNLKNGYNPDYVTIIANNNPALNCIQVDSAAYSYAHWTTGNLAFAFDAGVFFSKDCASSSCVIAGTDSHTACGSFTWIDGIEYTGSNNTATYLIPHAAAGDCDSLVTLDLTILDLPVVNLGIDTAICTGSSLTLNAGNAGASYLWNDNSIAQTLSVTTAGTYYVKVTGANDCFKSDTIVIAHNALPIVNLGIDTAICAGSSLTLDAGNACADYLWNDNSLAQALTVATAGTYYVKVTDANNCSGSDTVIITQNALPAVNLGPDVSICAGSSSTLDAGNAGSDYLWNDNSTTQTFQVTAAGQYWVKVTDANGCKGADTVSVSEDPLPVINGISDSNNGCDFDFGVTGATDVSVYTWDFGDGTTTTSITANISHAYEQDGNYTVKVTASNDCGSVIKQKSVACIKLKVSDVELVNKLTLYPNPASGNITIEGELEIGDVTFTDVTGRIVSKNEYKHALSCQIDISQLSNGVYTVIISTEKGIVTKKLEVLK